MLPKSIFALLIALTVPALASRRYVLLSAHSKPVTAVAWDPTARKIVSSGWDSRCLLSDPATGKSELLTSGNTGDYRTDRGEMDGVSWNRSEGLIAIAQRYRVIIFDPAQRRQVRLISEHQAAVRSLSWSPDGKILVTNSQDGTVRMWNSKTWSQTVLVSDMRHAGWATAWSPDSRTVAVDCAERIAILSPSQPADVKYLDGQEGNVLSLDWAIDGTKLVSGTEKGTVTVWDVSSGRQVKTLRKQGERVNAVAWSQSGKWIAFGDGRKVKLISSSDWKAASDAVKLPSPIRSLSFRPDDGALAVGCLGGEVAVIDCDVDQ